jgi:hypothetical protein
VFRTNTIDFCVNMKLLARMENKLRIRTCHSCQQPLGNYDNGQWICMNCGQCFSDVLGEEVSYFTHKQHSKVPYSNEIRQVFRRERNVFRRERNVFKERGRVFGKKSVCYSSGINHVVLLNGIFNYNWDLCVMV